MSRYHVSSSEGQYEKDSGEQVLANKLGIAASDEMAVQGGYQPLDYQSWEKNKTQYISAIHTGMSMDYEPMKHWVREALRRD